MQTVLWMEHFVALKCQDVLFSLESAGNLTAMVPPVYRQSITETLNVPDKTREGKQVLCVVKSE